jgi:hypothetical protein
VLALYQKVPLPPPKFFSPPTSLLAPPENRLGNDRGAEEILAHPLFKDINTRAIREMTAPFVPQLSSETDLSYFDREGLEEEKLPLSPSFKPASSRVEGFTFKMPSTGVIKNV